MAEKVFRAEDRELFHFGLKGMKWGIRRFQNEDGSLTPAGKARYRDDGTKLSLDNMTDEEYDYAMSRMRKEQEFKQTKRAYKSTSSSGIDGETAKKIAVAALAGAATIVLTKAMSDEGITDTKKLVKEIILASGTTTIASIASAYGTTPASTPNSYKPSSGQLNNNDMLVKARNLKSVVGDPKGFTSDQEKAYNDLFKKNLTDEQKGMVKAMRKNGFSVDQITKAIL